MEVPGYKVECVLGRGGMATVYLAMQESLNRPVALKVLSSQLAADTSFADRFLKERRVIANLSHRHIVTVYDFGRFENNYYLAMEYLSGGSLQDRITEGLPRQEAILIAKAVAEALSFAHKKGCIHRDIKPLNILFRHNGTAVLSDFGIAKTIDSSTHLTAPGMMVGSPLYMSPEQIRGGDIDHRADLYSFGVLLYQMLTGSTPFKADNLIALANQHVLAPVPRLPHGLVRYQALIDQLLAKQREHRFASAQDVLEALQDIERGYAMATDTGDTIIAPIRLPLDDPTAERNRPKADLENSNKFFKNQFNKKKLMLFSGAAAGALILFIGIVAYISRTDPEAPTENKNSGGQSVTIVPRQVNDSKPATNDGLDNSASSQNSIGSGDQGQTADKPADTEKTILTDAPTEQSDQPGVEENQRLANAHRLLAQARQTLSSGDLENSLKFINAGLRLAPEDASLITLKQRLNADLAQKDQTLPRPADNSELKEQVGKLLFDARLQLARQNLTLPDGDNAYLSYRHILRLDPRNSAARQGIQQIGSRFHKRAEQALAEGDLDRAVQILERGLDVVPSHPDLHALQTELENQLAAKNKP